MKQIEGEMLIMREITPELFDITMGWLKDEALRRELVIRKHPYSEEEQTKWYVTYKNDRSKLIYIAFLKAENTPVGQVGFNKIDQRHRNGEIHIFVGEPEYRRCGYAGEMLNLLLDIAFHELDLNKVWLKVNDDNVSAVKFYQKMGFVREGLLERHELYEGQWLNKIILSYFAEMRYPACQSSVASQKNRIVRKHL